MFRRGRLACSFCGRSEAEVAKLVAGPRVYICDRCVALAREILAEHAGEAPPRPTPPRGFLRRLWSRLGETRNRDLRRPSECHAVPC